MRTLRSTWGARFLAVVLAATLLLPVVIRPPGHAAGQASAASVAWLRAQNGASGTEGFEEALAAARRAEAPTLRSFLTAFVEAYEARQPLQPVAEVFAAGERGGEALVRYLVHRYLRVGGAEAPSGLALVAALPALPALDRFPEAMRRGAAPAEVLLLQRGAVVQQTALIVLRAFRLFSSAQPLGP